MGVYIKGMEMPTNCNVCNFHMLRFCCAADKDLAEKDTRPLIERRPEWCPLVPVPPHGDLIDRDKLEKDIDKYIGGEESRSRFHHWVQVQRAVIHKSEEAHT